MTQTEVASPPRSEAKELSVDVDAVHLEAVIHGEAPSVFAGATGHIEDRPGPRMLPANAPSDVGGLGRVVLEQLSRVRHADVCGGAEQHQIADDPLHQFEELFRITELQLD